MNFYRTIFSLMLLTAPLINFSLIPGSKLPVFYLVGFTALLLVLFYDFYISRKVFGVEDPFHVIFMAIVIVSLLINSNEYSGARGITQLGNFILTYSMFKICLVLLYKIKPDRDQLLSRIFKVNTGWQVAAIIVFYVGLLSPSFLYFIIDFFNNAGNFHVGAIGISFETARSLGFCPEPSFWSFFIAMNIALGLTIKKPGKLFLAINFFNLFLTVGRTGFLILICVLIIKFAKESILFKLLLILLSFIGVFMVFEFIDFGSLKHLDSSISQRVDSIIIGLKLSMENPMLGIGLGNFQEYAEDMKLPYFDIFNLFLTLLVGVGVIGLLFYALFLLGIFRRLQTNYHLPFYGAIIGWMTVSAYNLPFVWLTFAALTYASVVGNQNLEEHTLKTVGK